jgi:Tol biopolymer transport system component
VVIWSMCMKACCRRLALAVIASGGTDIYVYELAGETMTRLTFGGRAQLPIWTPDGKHVAFRWTANGFGIGWIRSDGSGGAQEIFAGPSNVAPFSFSPDGSRLAYQETDSHDGSVHISMLPLDTSDPEHPKPGKPESFSGAASEGVPMFSPDGRWIAYRSNESGISEIYVRPFPGSRGGKWQISSGGGIYSFWSNNGRELFYETADHRIMAVDYTVNLDSFVPGRPRLWSERRLFFNGLTNLDLAPDGKRFAVFSMPETAGAEKGSVHVTFLLNFLDEMHRRIPVGR